MRWWVVTGRRSAWPWVMAANKRCFGVMDYITRNPNHQVVHEGRQPQRDGAPALKHEWLGNRDRCLGHRWRPNTSRPASPAQWTPQSADRPLHRGDACRQVTGGWQFAFVGEIDADVLPGNAKDGFERVGRLAAQQTGQRSRVNQVERLHEAGQVAHPGANGPL